MQQLAALVPRPRLHLLIRFHGVLAPNAKLRDTAVAVPERVFRWLGVALAKVIADYEALSRKHPGQFSSAEDVKAHVEQVLAHERSAKRCRAAH